MTGRPRATTTVEVVAYDPAWPARFEQLRDRLAGALGPLALSIEHVGSTSVPGLAAKPTIDIDVVVRSESDVPAAISALTALGYRHLGNLDVPGREAFARPPGTERHNVYVCPAGSQGLRNHLAVRDRLRGDGAMRDRYADLKRRLATEAGGIGGYTVRKTDLILEILADAGFPEHELAEIRRANELP